MTAPAVDALETKNAEAARRYLRRPGRPRALRVVPMDGGLVRLPPRPERERRGGRHERRALDVRVGVAQDRHQGRVTLAVGGDEVGVSRAAAEDVRLGRLLDQLGRPLPHVPGRPGVDVRLMTDQVAHLPARTAGDAGLQSGGLRRVGQNRAVTVKRVNMRGNLHGAHRRTRPPPSAR
jgi:hypothetical protein